MNVAFFDRDGTIAEDYPDAEWTKIQTPVLMPYAESTLRYFYENGYQIIIITNQYLIGEGFITQEQYEAYHEKLIAHLKAAGIPIFDTFYCPHARTVCCDCRKPKTGLIRQALKKYPMIDLPNSFVVGDSLCDMQMAEQMGIDAYGIKLSYSYKKFTRIENLQDLLHIFEKEKQ